MTQEQILPHRAPLTRDGDTAGMDGPITLPPDLLREASVRLGWAGIIYASAFALAYWAPFLINRSLGIDRNYGQTEHVFAIVSISSGIIVFLLSRYARLTPERFLDVGLVFAVFGAFGISMAEFWRGFPEMAPGQNYLGIPWECVWIIIVPLVAPNAPRKVLITSLIEAATGPLVVWYATAVRGIPFEEPVGTIVTYFLFTTFLCALIAYVIAGQILRYGVRLKRAREIGSYALVSQLGAGGMGEVWIARHRMLARPAAMKLIRPEILGADARSREIAIARFEREARATAGLGSTHTVSIYDFGLTDQGAFFYAMELLDGLSLETLVRRFGPLPPARAVYLLRQACHSLGEAHAAGLVHRDIKPANIFVCRLGPDFDFVKVLDFGLVKHVGGEDLTQVTGAGMAAGTPAYMAPEVAMGRPNVDGRADIYALGCVAYFLLTGEPVFSGPTPMATLLAHVQTDPVPPARRTELPIPPRLNDLVMACLSKDPANRPSSAGELDVRLGASCSPHAPWRKEDAREWWQLHQLDTPVVAAAAKSAVPVRPVSGDRHRPTLRP
jgi:eukaryotic-like serine/threonine-protein kinase